MTNLSFTITDIDYAACDFDDGVSITSASPYSYQIVNRTYVPRNGTLATPFSLTSYGYLMGHDDPNGNVRITFPSVTSFDLTYWNFSTGCTRYGDGGQKVYLTDLSFTYSPC